MVKFFTAADAEAQSWFLCDFASTVICISEEGLLRWALLAKNCAGGVLCQVNLVFKWGGGSS